MNAGQLRENQEKVARIRGFLQQHKLDGVILGRRDNFAWFSGGGDSTVVRTSELGFGVLVVTMRRVFMVAQTMDGPRIMDEELAGLEAEPVFPEMVRAGQGGEGPRPGRPGQEGE